MSDKVQIKKIKKIKNDDEEEEDVKRWLMNEYLKPLEINKNKIPSKINEKIRSDITVDNVFDTSAIDLLKYRSLNVSGMVDPVDYICVVQRATIESIKTTVNYSYLYYVYKDTKYEYTKEMSKALFPDKVELQVSPHFICISPSFLSQDGEYRPRIYNKFRYKQLVEEPKIYDHLKEFIVEKIEKHKIQLSNEFYYPLIDIRKKWDKVVESDYVDNGYPVNLFIMYWLGEVEKIINNMEENHINFKFKHVFFPQISEDIKFYKQLKKIISSENLSYYTNIIHSYTINIKTAYIRDNKYIAYKGIHDPPKIKFLLGQKLRPLSIVEAQNPENINYDPWREIYLCRKVNDILLNRISNGVPFGLYWFYIKNTHVGLFDNPVQEEKIKNSERGYLIVNKMREIQRLTFEPITDEFINDNFKHLYQEIDPDVEFVKSKLMISNVSLGTFSQNVGYTFYDVPMLTKSNEFIKKAGHVLKDLKIFKKYIFEIVFTLLGLNRFSGIVHSDLHLNNATIYFNDMEIVPDFTAKKYIYLYGVDNYWFQISALRTRAYVIDLSRSTIDPKELTESNLFKSKEDENRFIKDQNRRIFNKLKMLSPSIVDTYSVEIMRLIKEDFNKIYRLYTVVDMNDFSKKLKTYLVSNKNFGVDKSIIEFLDKIIKICDYYLNTLLQRIVKNSDTVIEWANLEILKQCFLEFLIDSNKKIGDEFQTLGYYYLNFDKTYEINDLKKLPSYLMSNSGITSDGKEYIISDSYKKGIERYDKYRKAKFGMIDFIAERHRKKYQ